MLITGWRQSATPGTSITLQDPLGLTADASPFEHITIRRPLRESSCWITDCCLLQQGENLLSKGLLPIIKVKRLIT